jgi:hypothetical protein
MMSRAWDLGVAPHRDVAQAVTVLTKRHQIGQRAVGSISVNVVKQDNFWVRVVSAVGAFSSVDFPSVFFVGARSLRSEGCFIPRRNSAGIRTKPSSGGDSPEIPWKIEIPAASDTDAGFASHARLGSAGYRAEITFSTMVRPGLAKLRAASDACVHQIWKARASEFHPCTMPYRWRVGNKSRAVSQSSLAHWVNI